MGDGATATDGHLARLRAQVPPTIVATRRPAIQEQ
jgi:hypothetical protein